MERHEELAKAFITYATAGKHSVEEIRGEALRAKRAIAQDFSAMNRSIAAIDSAVQFFAFDAGWEPNLPFSLFERIDEAPPQITGRMALQRPAAPANRAAMISEFADALERTGGETVSSRAIAEKLVAAGDRTDMTNLTVAVGNRLARTGWKRVRPGFYSKSDESDKDGEKN